MWHDWLATGCHETLHATDVSNAAVRRRSKVRVSSDPYHHSRITYFGPSLSLNVPVERMFTCSRDLKRPRSSKAKQLYQASSGLNISIVDCSGSEVAKEWIDTTENIIRRSIGEEQGVDTWSEMERKVFLRRSL